MNKSTSQKIKLGVFVVVGSLLLFAALYFIGNRQYLFSNNIQIYAEFANVNGLQLGNNVRYSGINVGTVGKIEMLGESKIIIEMVVEEKTGNFIRKNAIATIGSDGLVGSMVVNILPGKGEAPFVTSGDTIVSYSKIGADDMLSTLNVTNENAALLTSDLLKITNKILEGKGTLGVLIADTTMAGNIKETIEKLKATTISTSNTMHKLNKVIAKINMEGSVAGVLLNDTVTGQQLKTVLNNLEQSSDDINGTTNNLEGIVAEIKNGEGALNYLTTDEELVKDIDSTMLYIKESTFKLNQNMEALKHNFFFRGYFRKLERQKKRENKRN
ncbi:phospholipid/cholesterol/gamma-HCH transport system substrate-binding protein [Gillisia sp. Hel_I_86]|uniref:MlaD family protein n=1 Tax=Gillisia sp. Hel_I_86 TaxID=1249981 RepID=UPI00119A4EAF|nr:MlaD family protein [Gillisia sp. Hel_I_86]TVZ27551.1 phospholipid/cholesterol/gamma-HCH transport system substrate-binding protein [Gillisia sp. Hel_I_86]